MLVKESERRFQNQLPEFDQIGCCFMFVVLNEPSGQSVSIIRAKIVSDVEASTIVQTNWIAESVDWIFASDCGA